VTCAPRGDGPFYCEACEAEAIDPAALGFIDNDGWIGTIDGLACSACRRLWSAPGAVEVVTGRVDLAGRTPAGWCFDRLVQLGCDPQWIGRS
jgi:hypothetical protein